MAGAGRTGRPGSVADPGSRIAPIDVDVVGARTRLRLVGEFELSWRDRVIDLAWGAQRLLALLALKRHPVRRATLAGTLWMNSDERHAGGNLRSALWRLRSTGNEIVQATPSNVRLSPIVEVDLEDAIVLANAVTRPKGSVDVASVDAALLTRDLLPGWYEDWITFERERFRQLRLHALESLCERQVSAGFYAQAVQTGLAAVDADPLRESAHRALITAHLAEGNYGEARRQYRALADLLMADLGIEPSEGISKLFHVVAS